MSFPKPPGEKDKRRRVANSAAQREREIKKSLVVDYGADVGRFRLDHRGRRLHLDGLRHLAHAHGEIDSGLLVHLNLDAFHFLPLKALGFDGQSVGPDREVQNRIRSIFSGGRGVGQISSVGAACIGYGADHRASVGLGKKRGGG